MKAPLRWRALAAVAALLALAPPVQAQDAPLAPTGRWSHRPVGSAPTPPMGWSSWNAFGVDVSEDKLIGSAEVLVSSGLAAAGYRYVNIDDGWWLKRRGTDGRLQVRTGLFPSAAVGGDRGSSLRPFTDRLHAMGLKAGLYTDIGRNACSQAYNADSPNLPEGTQAEREVGLMGFVEQDIALYLGEWNFDYLKVDGCGLSSFGRERPYVASGQYREFKPLIVDTNVNQSDVPRVRALYAGLRRALDKARPDGRFALSVCLWGTANVRSWGAEAGTSWRTSSDIDATFSHMVHNFDSVATRELYAGPGRWNDPDMLEVGNGGFDAAHLTEARTHMSLWAIAAAPLVIGTDLSKAPREILDVLGAPEVLAIDQDPAGHQGVIAYTDDDREIVVKTLADGRKAVLLFNRSAAPTRITLTAEHLKLDPQSPIAVRDAWARRDAGPFTGRRDFELAPREAALLTVSGRPVLARGHYLSERPADIHVARDGIRALQADPVIHRMLDPYGGSTESNGSRPVYAGWGAPRADATPYDETLRIRNTAYRHGLGALADSRLEVKVAPGSTRFVAMVGVDDSTRGKSAPVRFEVYGDGRRLALSPPMRFNAPAHELSADLRGVKLLELVVRQQGRDTGPVVVTWGEARVE